MLIYSVIKNCIEHMNINNSTKGCYLFDIIRDERCYALNSIECSDCPILKRELMEGYK